MWLLQGVFVEIIWALLLLGGGALLAYLRVKRPQIALPALYGLAGAARIAIIWFTSYWTVAFCETADRNHSRKY
jgi:hypothetical protein